MIKYWIYLLVLTLIITIFSGCNDTTQTEMFAEVTESIAETVTSDKDTPPTDTSQVATDSSSEVASGPANDLSSQDQAVTPEFITDSTLYAYFVASDLTVEIEDSRGDQYILSYADLHYRFYLNAQRSSVLALSWKDANEIEPQYLTDFFTSQANWNQTIYEDIYLPSKFVEPYICRYFDVEIEHLRKSMYYDASADTYKLATYPAEFGSRITGASANGNVLTIYYEVEDWPAGDGSIYATGKVEIEIEYFQGHFRYISNKILFEK